MLKQRTYVPDDQSCFPTNEFDEILENNVSTRDMLDDETFSRLQGNFFKILTTQNGSRILQKSLKKTSKVVLSKLLNEVKKAINL